MQRRRDSQVSRLQFMQFVQKHFDFTYALYRCQVDQYSSLCKHCARGPLGSLSTIRNKDGTEI